MPPSFTVPNFDAAGVGLCFVYHLSYEDGLEGLAMGNNIEDFDGCFNLSNGIYVERSESQEICNPNETARYRVIFDAVWSEATHPVDFPSDPSNQARWSPVAGMTHEASTQYFVVFFVYDFCTLSIASKITPQANRISASVIINGGAIRRLRSLNKNQSVITPLSNIFICTFFIKS